MQITDSLLLGNARFGTNTSYEGLLNLQPIIYTMSEGSRACTYFTQFGNNFFIRPWSFEQEKIENIIKTGKAYHKVIKNEELEFLLAYNEVPELNLDFLYTLVGNSKRCTFILSNKNLQTILLSTDSFAKKFKSKVRTYQYKEDTSKLNNNYVFTLSIYSIDTIVANLKNKTIDGLGVAIEVFNKQYTQHYKTPYISYGCYLIFTNNYDDVLYRDCVEIIPQSSFDSIYIYEQICNYEKYCNNTKQQDDLKMPDFFKKMSIGKAVKPGKIAVLASKKKMDEPPVPEEVPQYAYAQGLKYEDFYIDIEAANIYQDMPVAFAEPQAINVVEAPEQAPLAKVAMPDVVDTDFDEAEFDELLIDKPRIKAKKVSPKSEDLWGILDYTHDDEGSKKVPISKRYHSKNSKIKQNLEEAKLVAEARLAAEASPTKRSKEELYKQLYNGSIKAIHEEMVSEISKDIVEKQKARVHAKNTTFSYYVNTSRAAASSSTAYTGAGFGQTTLKINMN